jgi:hypothetical protein
MNPQEYQQAIEMMLKVDTVISAFFGMLLYSCFSFLLSQVLRYVERKGWGQPPVDMHCHCDQCEEKPHRGIDL